MINGEAIDANPVSNDASPAGGKTFLPDKADRYLAVASFVLGFLFMRWLFFSWQGWGVSLFTLFFSGATLLYLRSKGKKLAGESWYWLAVLAVVGLSFSLWEGRGVFGWRALLLFAAAFYWVQVAAGRTLLGRTSDWLLLDLQWMLSVTFKHLGAQYRSLWVSGWRPGKKAAGDVWSIGLGVLFALPVIWIVGPLLAAADAGGFAALLRTLWEPLTWLPAVDALLLVQLVLSVPVAAFIFALLAGSVHREGQGSFKAREAESAMQAFRVLPALTVYTLLLLLNVLYLVFILTQLPYFFSAFYGRIPPGWESYAEFARRGFFELCAIAVINLAVLAGAHLGISVAKRHTMALRVHSIWLSVLTLLLIATAFSKVLLYISTFGLTIQRLLPSVFLVFLAVVFCGVILRQGRQFSVIRLALFTGVTLVSLLCVLDTDGLVAKYNADRYLAGTLQEFDTIVLYRAGAAGVPAALLLYGKSDNRELREALSRYLIFKEQHTARIAGTMQDTLQHALTRRKLAAHK
ncbi:MAG: hypothetical protein DDT21_02226 [Syntrophomonadaceae bacterium]|nr:hypothetical protein [Bacillota bacterium]